MKNFRWDEDTLLVIVIFIVLIVVLVTAFQMKAYEVQHPGVEAINVRLGLKELK